MATIELTCKTCGATFTPSKADVGKGPAWHWYCSAAYREKAFVIGGRYGGIVV